MSTLSLSNDYLTLLNNRVPMIDVRAPIEFETGALPFAENLPLLENDERRRVGLCYKQQGQNAAIALGHELVCGDVKERRINAWKDFTNAHPDAVLYCARGGLRSQLSQAWLAEAGVECTRVEGGLKSLRAFLLEYVSEVCAEQEFVLLSGMTGTGKTDIIKTLDRSIDLERMANHKGSSFGQPLDGQPSQVDFENALILELMHHRERHPAMGIILEDEGRNIGGRHLPKSLVDAMQRSSIVVIELTLEERLERLWQEYVVDRYTATLAFDPDKGEHLFAEYLRSSLFRIQKRLGGQRSKDLLVLMEQALERQHDDGFDSHRQWLEVLTTEYYDPMYRYQLDKRRDRVTFRGGRAEVLEWLGDRQSSRPSAS